VTLHLLLVLVLGGGGTVFALWRQRTDLACGWAVSSVVATALLAGALALPGGIPSPSATLAALPPWLATGETAGGNPLLRDVTFQIEPWLIFLRRELRAGRLPFWNPHQFSGAPFWANGQSAPLFPLHLLFAALPLQLGFVLLPWLRVAIGGCGAFLLARELALSRPAAALCAVIFPLSGMLVSFLLFPMGNALALVPWVLLTVERLATGRGGPAALGLAAGLQLLAGHPETVAHTALLAGLFLLVRGAGGHRVAVWGRFLLGWLGAGLLAAVQLLPVAFALPETGRWQSLPGGHPPLAVLLAQPLRLVLPQLFGHPAQDTWWGPFNYSATAVYAGALALPLAGAGLAACRRDRRWLAVAAVTVFSFAAAYHLPGLRDLLHALPVIGRAAHHRLLFGVELGLALLAGQGVDRWLDGRGRGALAGAGAAGLLLGAAWLTFSGDWAAHGLAAEQAGWSAAVVVAGLLLCLSLLLSQARRWQLSPFLLAVTAVDLLAAHGRIHGALPVSRHYPRTGAVEFLAGREGRVAGTGEALRPNAATVYGLADPRGDDLIKPTRSERLLRRLGSGDPIYFQPITRWESRWLDALAVRWVVTGPAEPPADPAWRLAYRGPDARVYERPSAWPAVRWEGTGGAAKLESSHPGFWRIAWRSSGPGRLVVAEAWHPGWSVRAGVRGGRSVPLDPDAGLLLAVPLAPGAGTVELSYRPPGFFLGAGLSAFGALALLFLAWRSP
jgi:hypothetical protein